MNWEILGILGLLRAKRANFLGVFALENSIFSEFWVCLLQKKLNPSRSNWRISQNFETPPTQIGPWAKIFETPPDELVAGGDLKGASPVADKYFKKKPGFLKKCF